MPVKPNLRKIAAENEELRARLEKTEESLREILSGESDALFVAGAGGAQLFALKGADQSYRTLIENMSEGALTLTSAGLILYANRRFAGMLGAPLEKVIGSEIHTWFAPESRQVLQTLLGRDAIDNRRVELELAAADGTQVPVNLSVSHVKLEGMPDSFCMVATDLTEQKRNEAILAEEELARAILEQAADAIVVCDRTGRILRASKQAQALYGNNPLGQHFERAFPLRQPDNTAFSPIGDIDTSPRQSVEARLERDGQGFDLLVSVGHLKGARNELVGSVVTLTDITERKRAIDLMQESETRYRALFDESADGIMIADIETKTFQDANPTLCRMLGYNADELRRMDVLDLHPKDAMQSVVAEFEALARGDKTHAIDIPCLRKDGSVVYVDISATLIDVDGRPCNVGFFRDITERRQAEEARKHREAELQESQRIARIGSWELAPATGAITWSDGMNHVLARDRALAAPNFETLQQFYTPESWQRLGDAIANTIGTGAPYDLELEMIRADGATCWTTTRGEAVRGADGTVVKLRGTVHDITARKQADTRIAYLNRVYAMLSGINTLIMRVHDRDELFREACRIAVEQGKFVSAWIGVVDSSARKIVPIASAGADQGFLEEVQARLSLDDDAAAGHGPAAEAVRKKQAMVVNDVRVDPRIRHKNSHADRGIRSLVHLPLLIAGAPVAVFGLHAAEAGFFDEQEMKLLRELAGDIAFAIEHIEKEKKLAHLSRIQMLMASIGALIVRVRDRDELFREACRIALEAGGFRMSLICIVDRSVMKIVPVASAGKDEELLAAIKRILSSSEDAPRTMVARAIREKKAVVANDSKSDARVLFGTKYAAAEICSIAVLPLIVADEVLGVLALYANETGFFDEGEMRLLTELAGDVAFAIDNIDKRERLDYLAYYDALTGLANRRLFLDRVAQYISSAVSGGHKLAVYLIDLERFRNINDSLGRPAGDALLRQVAEWLTRNAGDANLLARVDADHFAAVMPVVRQGGDAGRLLEKWTHAFMEHPFRLNDAVFRIAAKVGVAVFPDDGADAEALYRNAEAAVKKAKASGERYLFYNQKMTEAVAGKLSLENQLRQALDNEEFVLHYQPKVNLLSGKVTSAEALIRWNDPRTGLVPPGRFIPILEETGLIYDVGRWALRKAIADYLRWRALGLPAVRVAVNVSLLQLRNRGFIDEVRQAIGIDAHAAQGLELEITESLIMEDVKGNIATLGAIRDLGVCIAIDDFGTGFSSLAYLARLPVHTLKIDRSFVIDMTAGPEGLALVSTIINLAHSLKLKVVAEGVETEEQSRLLRLLSCDEMQGFLFSKPVPVEIFEAKFLAAGSSA